ncbi:HDOD domain-containing protein [Candidatus Latescibacterota bacterium]
MNETDKENEMGGKGPTILFVDGDKNLADEYRTYFEGRDYRFHHLADPRAISKTIGARQPDVLVMEIAFDEMGGDDIIRGLRKKGLMLPIVILSRMASKELVMAMRQHRISGFFIKPVSPETLEGRLKTIIGAQSTTVQPRGGMPIALIITGNREHHGQSHDMLPLEELKEYEFKTVFASTPQEAVNTLKTAKNSVRLVIADASDPPYIRDMFQLLEIIDRRMNIPLYLIAENIPPELKEEFVRAGIGNLIDKSDPASKRVMGQLNTELLSHYERINQRTAKKRWEIIQHLKNISSLPPLPDIYLKIEALASEPDTTVSDYGKVLELDPAITARLLRMSNSALYPFKRKINSVKDAVALMGTQEILSLVRLACITGNIRIIPEVEKYTRKIWRHSATCAIAAKQIDQNLSIFSEEGLDEELFIGGIIHDIGKIVLSKISPDAFLSYARNADHSMHWNLTEEKAVMGINHCEVGLKLAEHWKLPDQFGEVIFSHHNPERNYESNLLKAIYLANIVAHGITEHFTTECTKDIDPEFLKINDLTCEQVGAFVEKSGDDIYQKAEIVTQMIAG